MGNVARILTNYVILLGTGTSFFKKIKRQEGRECHLLCFLYLIYVIFQTEILAYVELFAQFASEAFGHDLSEVVH